MVSIPASPDALYDAYVPSLLFHKRFDEASLSGHKLSAGAGGCEARGARRHIDGVARRCCGKGLRRTAQVRAMLAPPPSLPVFLIQPVAASLPLRQPCPRLSTVSTRRWTHPRASATPALLQCRHYSDSQAPSNPVAKILGNKELTKFVSIYLVFSNLFSLCPKTI
jgi:hypothetical protein